MNVRNFNEQRFKAVIQEIAEECHCAKGYCFFRGLIETMKTDIRILVQFKAIEKYKWEESERQKFDIGWHEAGMQWVDKGFAAKFAEVYDEELTVKEIYLRTIGKK